MAVFAQHELLLRLAQSIGDEDRTRAEHAGSMAIDAGVSPELVETLLALRGGWAKELPPAIDVRSVLQEVAEEIEGATSQTQLDVQMASEEMLVRMRVADLRSIASNLLRNALEAGATAIRLSVQPTSDRVRIIVSDNGPGMDSRTQSRAFEPAFSTKRDAAGLGLPLVQHLADRLDGEVVLESRPGQGTRVVVSLPRHHAFRAPATSGVRTRASLKGLRIVVGGKPTGTLLEAIRDLGAEVGDIRSTVDAGHAVDIAVLGGVLGSMMLGALRPLAECIVWVGDGDMEDGWVDASLDSPQIDAFLAIVEDLYAERKAV
ncbi:MAG: ATP-binding protein [Myxococcota bacterium]